MAITLKDKPGRELSKTAFDCKHAQSVSAWALIWEGESAGRIVADWSDNPNGSVCRATVHVWTGPLKETPGTTGTAGGGGYCKFSAAVYDALDRVLDGVHDIAGRGESAVEKFFTDQGYSVIRVL